MEVDDVVDEDVIVLLLLAILSSKVNVLDDAVNTVAASFVFVDFFCIIICIVTLSSWWFVVLDIENRPCRIHDDEEDNEADEEEQASYCSSSWSSSWVVANAVVLVRCCNFCRQR